MKVIIQFFPQQSPHAGSCWASWRVGGYRLQKGCRSWEDNNNRQDGDLSNLSVLLRKSEPSSLTEGLPPRLCFGSEKLWHEKDKHFLFFFFSLCNSSTATTDNVFLFIKQLTVKFSSQKSENQAKGEEEAVSSAKLSALIYEEPYQVPSVKLF